VALVSSSCMHPLISPQPSFTYHFLALAQVWASILSEVVIGADNFVDTEGCVGMKNVLGEVVDTTRTVTPTSE